MLFQHFDWDLTNQVLFLYLLPSDHTYELERPAALKMHMLWCRTDICSCKLSPKVSFMLHGPFPVPSLCKLNLSAFVSSRLARRSPTNSLFPSGKALFFYSDLRCFGLLGKFQHNIEISIKTAHVSGLFFPFLWLWLNRVHGRTLRIIYEDCTSSFSDFLTMLNEKTIYQRFINFLMTEVFRYVNGLSPDLMNKVSRLKPNYQPIQNLHFKN